MESAAVVLLLRVETDIGLTESSIRNGLRQNAVIHGLILHEI